MSIKNKINRLKSHINLEKAPEKMEKPQLKIPSSSKMDIPFIDVWEKAGFKPYYTDEDYCLIREVSFPIETKYGKYLFKDFKYAVESWNNSDANHPLSSKGFNAEELFFFDTETTGLGGGTGNTIFLLGYASLVGDQLVLKQHILPNPGSEVPFYKSFVENVNYSNMVTYNGKAFDWPQVKTRHTMIREHVPKLPLFGHFDLYHAARRMWKHKLERLKLSIVEKEILEIERVDDIPGYLAPMIYFDFVERKNPEGMLGIIKHNEKDILSLVTLYTHLSFQLLSVKSGRTPKETYEVGRWYSYIGEEKEAEKIFSEIANGKNIESIKAKHALAFQAKKRKDWQTAIEFWEEVSEIGDRDLQFDACVELAKIYEHKLKNIDRAISNAEKANLLSVDLKNKKIQEAIEKRMDRLRRKWN